MEFASAGDNSRVSSPRLAFLAMDPQALASAVNLEIRGHLPGHLGIVFDEIGADRAVAHLPVISVLMATNGFLHAGAVTTLADTVCATACQQSLPPEASNFTTIELKSNFVGTVSEGVVCCEGTRVHGGRTTQVWDAVVTDQSSGRTLALFRATQLILFPRN